MQTQPTTLIGFVKANSKRGHKKTTPGSSGVVFSN